MFKHYYSSFSSSSSPPLPSYASSQSSSSSLKSTQISQIEILISIRPQIRALRRQSRHPTPIPPPNRPSLSTPTTSATPSPPRPQLCRPRPPLRPRPRCVAPHQNRPAELRRSLVAPTSRRSLTMVRPPRRWRNETSEGEDKLRRDRRERRKRTTGMKDLRVVTMRGVRWWEIMVTGEEKKQSRKSAVVLGDWVWRRDSRNRTLSVAEAERRGRRGMGFGKETYLFGRIGLFEFI